MQNSITFLNTVSIRTLDAITFELNKDIPGCDWKSFEETMQDIFHEDWLPKIYDQVRNSKNPSEIIFKCWSTKDSYTIGNLIKILERMEHHTLLKLIRSKIEKLMEL